MLCRLKTFITDRRAIAALEFAIVLPILLVMVLAGLQLVTYIRAVRKVELVANSISQMISQAAPTGTSSTALVNQLDLHFAYDAALVIFPYLMADSARQNLAWYQDITIDFAGIQFVQILPTCSGSNQSACYVANVVWTSTGTAGNNFRPCVVPQLPTASSVPSRTAIPSGLFGPGSIIAVDVVFTFHPTFGSAVMSPITIARSVYLQPRYATLINYDTTNSDGIATKCPGY